MTCVIPSQIAYSFIISNASHSMHCSSVEAYLLWKCCSHILIFVAKRDAQSKAWDILLVLTSVAGYLCNKCPSSYLNKTAVKVILSMRSLVSIEQQSPRRPCDISNTRNIYFLFCMPLTRGYGSLKVGSCLANKCNQLTRFPWNSLYLNV